MDTITHDISPTLELNEKCRALTANGVDVIRWGFGQSPFPAHPSMIGALKNKCHKNQYLPVQGLYELRQLIANYYQKFNVSGAPENIVLGPGSKELLFILTSVFDGEFIIPTPSWVSYFNQLKLLGKSWLPIETTFETGWKVQPSDLESVLIKGAGGPKILILNNPNNPTGQIYSRAELEELIKVCRKHNIWVLSDEIYNELIFDGKCYCSIAELYPEGSIISNGISKSFDAGGWRFGYLIFPAATEFKRLKDLLIQLGSETFSCVSAPIQFAMIEIFKNDTKPLQQYIQYKNEILKTQGEYIAHRLREMGVKTWKPRAGFYIFVDFEAWRKPSISARDFFVRMLDETQIALLTGESFGRDGEAEWTARLAFVDLDPTRAEVSPRIDAALDRLSEWLDNLNE